MNSCEGGVGDRLSTGLRDMRGGGGWGGEEN